MTEKANRLKIIAETESLVYSLAFASSIVEKLNVISELANIKLSAKDNMLELSSTNMDLYLSQKIGVQVINEGVVTVSTKTLHDVIKKLPDTEITLNDLGTTGLQIVGKSCNFNLFTLPAELFPAMEDMHAEVSFKVFCSDFAKIIEATRFSISQDETCYNLNGIYLHIQNNKFYVASTDGHRLSVSFIVLNEQVENFCIIVPQKSAEEISKILKDSRNANAEIEISLSNSKVQFICNKNIVLLSKLVDGTFPDYNAFIPKENKSLLVINRKIFAEVIDRIAIITVDKFRAIKLSLFQDKLEVSAIGEAVGNATEIILASKNTESFYEYNNFDPLIIGFNPQYLEEIFKVIKSEVVELHFTDASSPVLIIAPGSPQDIFVVMPVKV